MTTNPSPVLLRKTQARAHANCVVCGAANCRGLQMEFKPTADGGVEAAFDCEKAYEGYARVLHGGVISALLDGAMTNCLFYHGAPGLTGELTVRFREPVRIETPALIRAWIDKDRKLLQILKAELTQDGRVKAAAVGKFVKIDADSDVIANSDYAL